MKPPDPSEMTREQLLRAYLDAREEVHTLRDRWNDAVLTMMIGDPHQTRLYLETLSAERSAQTEGARDASPDR